jgi:hypothetical protein
VPMAIAANKTDLPPERHRVTLEHAKTVLGPFNCPIMETSAKVRPAQCHVYWCGSTDQY